MIAPNKPLEIEEVAALWPTLRQSLLSNFDDCPLSAFFAMKHANGWSTSPQARGTIFHRTAAEILRTMRAQGHRTIPRREAVEILIETLRQEWTRNERGEKIPLPAEDIVRVPMRSMPELRMAVDKFAKDNEFSTHKIVDIEKKLEAPISYTRADGRRVTRTITGTLDVLLFDPPDGSIVIDWKDTFGLPPEPRDSESQGYDDEELKGLSFHGYFQQRVYGYLVMMNYRNVDRVTLREFYVRKTKVRKATLHRHQLPDVEEDLRVLVAAIDAALEQGAPDLSPGPDGSVDMEALGWWTASPGRHCGFCLRPTSCPIPEEVRASVGGAATTREQAARWAARLTIAERIRNEARDVLKGWVETSGEPVPVKWAKGRQVIGWFRVKNGRRFGLFTPDESDRGGHADQDQQLKDAMAESTERARQERGVQPRRRGQRRRTPA